jgi:hypothetical protein
MADITLVVKKEPDGVNVPLHQFGYQAQQDGESWSLVRTAITFWIAFQEVGVTVGYNTISFGDLEVDRWGDAADPPVKDSWAKLLARADAGDTAKQLIALLPEAEVKKRIKEAW